MSIVPSEIKAQAKRRSLRAESVYWIITAVLGGVAMAIATGLWPMSQEEIQLFQRNWTLPFYALVTLWVALAGALVLRAHAPRFKNWREPLPVVLAVLAGGFWLQAHEPMGWRVLLDEPGHAAAAYALYAQGSAETAYSFHLCENGDWVTRYHSSQRMGLYPFLGSLLHSLAGGAHPKHLLWLNGLLGFALLGAGAAVGSHLAGRLGALWTVALLTFLPLVAQLAVSGSYDLLFGVLLLFSLGQTLAYVSSPTSSRLSLLFALGAALTLSRYEGALFLGIIAALCWWREGRSFRPGPYLPLAALALIPTSMVVKTFLETSKVAYNVEGTFGLGNIPGNLADTLKHLFVPLHGESNFGLLGWFALPGLLVLAGLWKGRGLGRWSQIASLAWIGALLFQNLSVVAASFWSTPDDPATARLMLPVWIAAAVAGGFFLSRLRTGLQPWLCAGVALWLLVFQLPSWSRHRSSSSMIFAHGAKLYADFAARMPPRSLFLTDGPSAIALLGHACGASPEFDEGHQKTAGVVAAGFYERVFIQLPGNWTTDPKTGLVVFAYDSKKALSPKRWEIAVRERHVLPGNRNELHLAEVIGWKDDEGVVHPMSELPPGAVPPAGMTPGEAMAWLLDF